MMDPRKQECFGRYGWGTGWFSQLRLVQEAMAHRMGVVGLEVPGFCNVCPVAMKCLRDVPGWDDFYDGNTFRGWSGSPEEVDDHRLSWQKFLSAIELIVEANLSDGAYAYAARATPEQIEAWCRSRDYFTGG